MAAATSRVDDMIKDYLAFRGLSSTLRVLENELKNEREKSFRIDKMTEQIQYYIGSYDLANLRDYWNFLNHRLFSRLEQRFCSSIRKLEVGLLKFYLVYAAQSNKQDKVIEFFEKMTETLQTQSEFKEWFAFPFVHNREENSHFSMYFSRQWQDTFFLSLHNFLSVVLQAMPEPALLNFEHDHRRQKMLQEENELLKKQLRSAGSSQKQEQDLTPEIKQTSTNLERVSNATVLAYDFSALGEETALPEKKPRSPRRFPFPSVIGSNITKKKEEPARPSSSPSPKPKTNKISMKTIKKTRPLPIQSQQSETASLLTACKTLTPVPELSVTNQKLKKNQDFGMQRKELLGLTSETLRGKEPEKKGPETGPSNTTRSLSVEHSKVCAMTEVQDSSSSSKINKSQSFSYVSTDEYPVSDTKLDSSDSTSSYMKELATTAESSIALDKPTKLESFPSINSFDVEVEKATQLMLTSSEKSDDVPVQEKENPFILLSQEEYTEHRSSVSYCRFSNSGQHVASVDVDGVVKVWTWSPQPVTAATVMSKAAFLSLEWANKSDRWLLLGNRSGNIRLFDVKEMKSFYEATGDPSYPRILCLCANPNSHTFVCSSTVNNRTRTGSLGGDIGPVVGSKVGRLTVWDLKSMKIDRQLSFEPGPVAVNCCSFNHNGQLLLTGAADGVIRLFDMHQSKCISQWEAHVGEVRGVQFSSNETSCYSMGMEDKFCEWNMNRLGKKIQDLNIHSGAVPQFLTSEPIGNKEIPRGKLFAFDAEGKYLLTCDETKGVIYKVQDKMRGVSKVIELKGHRSAVTTVDLSPDNGTKVALTGSMDGKIRISTLLSH
ncbi:hypothetical protein CHS0354_007861 [Potamilus streckersoni]|uniref:WD repeat-containing protein 91 n=1 Tax=Potamilus streckersoni TaxID=2493646 RepID=A0AAE0VXY9_9BIVA|nr:hypothetical protein CHS0354_007861 [Potamilus streckersoni]